jgi:hypothetical protein
MHGCDRIGGDDINNDAVVEVTIVVVVAVWWLQLPQ